MFPGRHVEYISLEEEDITPIEDIFNDTASKENFTQKEKFLTGSVSCLDVSGHTDDCPVCGKLYDRNWYLTIIIILVIVILFLLIKS